ncbi:MAG: single-stranded DNA-binding protein [Bacteroidetes bacterium]|nr:MAG: single-stranded DNA-binding protein [Bacteroidota bacterium]
MAKYGLNRVTLIGNLGADPELRYLDQGIALATLRMACTERYRDKEGNYVDRTDWIDVNLWRSQAEIVAKFCRKGSTLYVEGRLVNRSWETPEGEKRYKTEVQGTRVILLDSRPATSPGAHETMTAPVSSVPEVGEKQAISQTQEAQQPQTPQQETQNDEPETFDDDLPF